MVEDNGVGIADPKKVGQGYGLQNVKERLKMYYGESASLQIDSVINKGTRVQVRFQLRDRESEGDQNA